MMAAYKQQNEPPVRVLYMGIWADLYRRDFFGETIKQVVISIDNIPANHELMECVKELEQYTPEQFHSIVFRCDDIMMLDVEEYATFYAVEGYK
ncbi:MAG: hypothetical protein ACYTBJ_27395 [Planctomycetota bacterium]|jgi:hypothetical protein